MCLSDCPTQLVSVSSTAVWSFPWAAFPFTAAIKKKQVNWFLFFGRAFVASSILKLELLLEVCASQHSPTLPVNSEKLSSASTLGNKKIDDHKQRLESFLQIRRSIGWKSIFKNWKKGGKLFPTSMETMSANRLGTGPSTSPHYTQRVWTVSHAQETVGPMHSNSTPLCVCSISILKRLDLVVSIILY